MSGIKAGDLVMVVKALPCCGDVSRIGRTYQVREVVRLMGACPVCKEWFRATNMAMGSRYGMHLQCLIRIDAHALIDALRRETA